MMMSPGLCNNIKRVRSKIHDEGALIPHRPFKSTMVGGVF